MVLSRQGGWTLEEGELLIAHFGEETTLDIIERSPIEPRVVITWVEWDRLPPSIYLVDFRERTKYDTAVCEEFMSVADAKASKWAGYFPATEQG
ncbi:MAG TPA: hypothetical protein VIL85_08330 [Thermomicrobiales bacterium]|jgi:hypothetical protein